MNLESKLLEKNEDPNILIFERHGSLEPKSAKGRVKTISVFLVVLVVVVVVEGRLPEGTVS